MLRVVQLMHFSPFRNSIEKCADENCLFIVKIEHGILCTLYNTISRYLCRKCSNKPVGWTMYDCRFSPINVWPPPSHRAPNYWRSHRFPFPMRPSIPQVYLCLCTGPLGIHLSRSQIASMQSMTWSSFPSEFSLCKTEKTEIF